jgi:hypothetical protein
MRRKLLRVVLEAQIRRPAKFTIPKPEHMERQPRPPASVREDHWNLSTDEVSKKCSRVLPGGYKLLAADIPKVVW